MTVACFSAAATTGESRGAGGLSATCWPRWKAAEGDSSATRRLARSILCVRLSVRRTSARLSRMDRGGRPADKIWLRRSLECPPPRLRSPIAQSTPKSFGPRLYECARPGPERPSELIAMHAPRSTSTRAGASKSDPYYERRVVSSPSARYAGSPSLRNPSSPSIQRSPSYYQYGPAQPPAHWLRDDVTYARPAPPRHPLLTQMISDVGSGGSGGGGGFWSRGGSIPLMYCSYVENETGTAAVPIGCWLRAA